MVDSQMVLFGQTLAYTLYSVAIILVVGWFGWKLTRPAKGGGPKPVPFFAFVGVLAVLGFSLHIITLKTIPWVEQDLHRGRIVPDKVFEILVANHEFRLPSDRLFVAVGEKVLFDVTTDDLTYGFGVFRHDGSMVFQMQVVPGHKNQVLWVFHEPGTFSIRSTEYSGPKGIGMVLENVLEVQGSREATS